jgi:aspartate/methionine/tyrosine aminotransferase
MDSWYTKHTGSDRLHNILEVPGALECCVTVLSVSKEFGLPGLRVGLIAGNESVINTVRIHNSTFAVMIPEVCQHAAEAALQCFTQEGEKAEINDHITAVLHRTLEGWKSLGWPNEAIHKPVGGFKYLVSIPPGIEAKGSFSRVELLDFYIATRAYVKLSTSRSFNPADDLFLRVVLMQNMLEAEEVFRRLHSIGVNYEMTLPGSLADEYESFLAEHISNNF